MTSILHRRPITSPMSIGIAMNTNPIVGCPYTIITHMDHMATIMLANSLHLAAIRISGILDDREWDGWNASDKKCHQFLTYPYNIMHVIMHVHIEQDPGTGMYSVYDLRFDKTLLDRQSEDDIRDLTLDKLLGLTWAARH